MTKKIDLEKLKEILNNSKTKLSLIPSWLVQLIVIVGIIFAVIYYIDKHYENIRADNEKKIDEKLKQYDNSIKESLNKAHDYNEKSQKTLNDIKSIVAKSKTKIEDIDKMKNAPIDNIVDEWNKPRGK